MKGKKTNLTNGIHRIMAVVLLGIFVFISSVQIFHTHQISLKDFDQKEQSFSKTEDCKICDHFLHHQSKHFIATETVYLAVPLPKAITLNHKVVAKIYKFTLQGFSNKGPPGLA